jgi:RNA polymerase subunit RPABC4/transcription elongation factor Spt4
MKECPKCKTQLEDDELFCHECGTKQEVEEVVQTEELVATEEKYCVHCGKAMEADSAFCPFCGKPQDVEEVKNEEPQKEVEKEEPNQEPVEPEHVQTDDQGTVPPPQPESSEQSEQPKQSETEERPTDEWEEEKKPKTWLWILLVLLIAGAAGWYFFIKDSGNTMYESQVDTDSIEEIVDSIYDEEAYDAFSVEGIQARLNDILSKALMMREDDAVRTYFSEEFRGLYARVAEKDSHLDGPGFWNGNIWDGGQDGDPGKYTIIRVGSPNDNKADAGVKFSYDMVDYHSDNLITIELVFENGDWYIDDVDANKQGMITYLKDEDSSSDTDEVNNSQDSEKSQLRGNELSIRKLTEKDIEGLSSGELEILRNVVYARYGYLFQREDLRRFFLQYSWYQPTNKDANEIYDNFTEIERYNIDFIKRHE